MEIFELLFGMGDACGCFLQVGAMLADAAAATSGYRMHRDYKRRKNDPATEEESFSWRRVLLFLALVLGAAFLTSLAVTTFAFTFMR